MKYNIRVNVEFEVNSETELVNTLTTIKNFATAHEGTFQTSIGVENPLK